MSSAIMGPADACMDIYVGRAIEIRSIGISQVGIGIAAIIIEVNRFTAEGTGDHNGM